jgi:hypothetical protein
MTKSKAIPTRDDLIAAGLMERPGPKYKVTPAKEELVASALVAGVPLKVALAAAGLKPRTWYRHLERRRWSHV